MFGHRGKRGENSRKNGMISCVKYIRIIRISAEIIKTSLCGTASNVIDKLPPETFSKWRQKPGNAEGKH